MATLSTGVALPAHARNILSRIEANLDSSLSLAFAAYFTERHSRPLSRISDNFNRSWPPSNGNFLALKEEHKSAAIFFKFASTPSYLLPFLSSSENGRKFGQALLANRKPLAEHLNTILHSSELPASGSSLTDGISKAIAGITGKTLAELDKQSAAESRLRLRTELIDSLPAETVSRLESYLTDKFPSEIALSRHVQDYSELYTHKKDIVIFPERVSVYRDFRMALICEVYQDFLKTGEASLLDLCKLLRYAADHKRAPYIEGICREVIEKSPELRVLLKQERTDDWLYLPRRNTLDQE